MPDRISYNPYLITSYYQLEKALSNNILIYFFIILITSKLFIRYKVLNELYIYAFTILVSLDLDN